MTGSTGASPLGNGRFAVPGNRWDLLDHAGTEAAATADVSVIIPFFDNQHDLDLVLAALSVQTHPLDQLQIVIADDGSPEPPRVPEVAAGLNVSIVRQEDAGFRAGTARNLGVAHSDGQVLVFLDGDTVPSPDYVHKLVRLPAALPDAVVSGRRRYADLSSWNAERLVHWFTDRHTGPQVFQEPAWMTDEYRRTQDLLQSHPRSYKYLIGAVLGCSREMFDETGGFDGSIVGYGGEDYDFTYRAYNCGAVLAYVPEAVAWHDGHDWAARTEPASQTDQKNREVMMLAARIPEPSMRGRGQIYPVADVIVTVHPDGWSFGAGVRCVRSLLASLDCAVMIQGAGESTDHLRVAFGADPRVRDGLPTDAANLLDQRRSRVHVDVMQPVLAASGFDASLADMLEADVGTLTIDVDEVVVVQAESHRRRSRSARYPLVAQADAAQWFSHDQRQPQDCGLEMIRDDVALAAVFGGY